MTSSKLLQALKGKRVDPPPIWLMRQAGRYLPEYRELRSKAATFLDFCHSPHLAAEATLQPIRRFGLDAAILFSDILVAPDALGQHVSFEGGDGPRLAPLDRNLRSIRSSADFAKLEPVFETVAMAKRALAPETALIGFCGAPWTVATYMVAGCGGGDQQPARLFAYEDEKRFADLIDILVRTSIDYLLGQIEAGVDAVQIFDSWAGVLPNDQLDLWCVQPVERIVRGVKSRAPHTPVILFPRGVGSRLQRFAALDGVDALGLDTACDAAWAHRVLPSSLPVQGNVDPVALTAGGKALDQDVDHVLDAFTERPHIVNLGYGISPQTPVSNVERLVARVRGRLV